MHIFYFFYKIYIIVSYVENIVFGFKTAVLDVDSSDVAESHLNSTSPTVNASVGKSTPFLSSPILNLNQSTPDVPPSASNQHKKEPTTFEELNDWFDKVGNNNAYTFPVYIASTSLNLALLVNVINSVWYTDFIYSLLTIYSFHFSRILTCLDFHIRS